MLIKPISLTLSDNIQSLIEMQKFYRELYNEEVLKLGIPEAWGWRSINKRRNKYYSQ